MPDRATTAQDEALQELEGHRWWKYRSCAPAPGAPTMARADTSVPLTAFVTPDAETQPARAARETAAVGLCNRCPLREQCLAYALGDTGGPYETSHIWGGMTAHERRELLATRNATPAPARHHADVSALDLTVLRALAAHRAPAAVAKAASMTVVRTNWHRARLVTALRLDPKTTTRLRLLYTARLTGLIDPAAPYLSDGGRIIAAIPSRQPAVTRSRGIQLPLPGLRLDPATPERLSPGPTLRLLPTGTAAPAAPDTPVRAAA